RPCPSSERASSRRPHLPAGQLQPAPPPVLVRGGLDLQLPAVPADDHTRLNTAAVADRNTMVGLQGRLLRFKQEAAGEALDAGPNRGHRLPGRRDGVAPLILAAGVAADFDAVR